MKRFPAAGAVLLLLPLSASAQVAMLPARPLDAGTLDRVFDGKRDLPALDAVPAGPSFIIRPENDPLPKAPRFALNLDAVPPELRSTVDGFELLAHKNQEETPAQVERMNALIRRHNAAHPLRKIPEWTYDGHPNKPPFVCLSYAAGTVNDWWALQLGRELPSYVNQNSGRVETGLDPRLLELEYVRRAYAGGGADYFLAPTFIEDDPVRHTASPTQPRGYANLLLEEKPYEVVDPVTGETKRWDPSMSAMEGRSKVLFSGNVLQPQTPERNARILAEGIDKWGVAYLQTEDPDRPRLFGAHTVVAVGTFCMEEGQKLLPCSENRTDAEWARRAYFILHDSFGDFPADKVRDAEGGSAYRAVRIASVDKAIVFPHTLKVLARPEEGRPGVWRLAVANLGGRPVKVLSVAARTRGGVAAPVERAADGAFLVSGALGAELVLEVEARHYYEADGKARTFRLPLEAGLSEAREAARTGPTDARPDYERGPSGGGA